MILGYAALVAFVGGGLLSMFPLWSSANLAEDSVHRRVYWTGTVVGSVLLFLSQLPDWKGGLFVTITAALAMFMAAGFWTDHIRIGGRIYSASNFGGRAGRPPVRRDDD